MKFKTGDPVRIIARTCRYFDEVGTVADIKEDQSARFHVAGLEPWALWFEPHELLLAEHPTVSDETSQP